MSLRTTLLTSALATAVAVAACGGSTRKKSPPILGDAGAAGEAGARHEAMGGSAGAIPQEPEAGSGGSELEGTAGAAGAAGATANDGGNAGADSGEAGAGPVGPPPVHVLFTVGHGAQGLPGSALSGQAHPTSVIFGSRTESPDPSSGTNQVVFTAAQLGLADLDTIDAFAIISPEPRSPMYLFSVAGAGVHSVRPTRLNRSSLEDGAPGDVYFSDATVSYHALGEGGDRLGYNGLIANERSLGLFSTPNATILDDLTGVQPLLDGALPSEIYFSVEQSSTGLPNTAIAASTEEERGCTIYKSALDGTNSVAYRCAELGLVADADSQAEITGLALLGTTTQSELLFTVSANSQGLAQTAVDAAVFKANNVYQSTADGTNSLRVSGSSLGLSSSDVLDALSVIDRALPNYGTASNCNLTPYPFDVASANLSTFSGAHSLGDHLILIAGRGPFVSDATPPDGIAAYDLRTCMFLARTELEYNALQGRAWTPVPLSGWSASDPLQKLEYWRFISGSELSVDRFDAAGTHLNSYAFTGIPNLAGGFGGFSLDYDAIHDRLVGVLNPNLNSQDYVRILFARPPSGTPDGTQIPVLASALPHPCAYSPAFSGVDSDGTTFFAQYDATNDSTAPQYRVCPLSLTGEFAAPPFSVSIANSFGSTNWGLIVPNDAIYTLNQSYFTITRQALTRP